MKRKSNIKRLAIFFVIFAFFFTGIIPLKSQLFYPGEDLLYEVSYMGIKLGTIRLVSESLDVINNFPAYKVKAYIESYNGIPFVDIKGIMQSWVDTSITHSYKLIANTKKSEDSWLFEQVQQFPDKCEVDITHWLNKKLILSDTIKTKKKYSDGLSLLFFARNFGRTKSQIKIPTIIYKDTSNTSFNFLGKKEAVEVSSIKYPVKTRYFNGELGGKGIYGLTGDFEGWISDDSASIPIKAKLNVYLGYVNIELIKWKRNAWTPPKAF
jgi:hypothetical protein